MKTYPTFILCLLVIFSMNACNNNSHADIDTSLKNTYTPTQVPISDSVSPIAVPGNNVAVTTNSQTTVALNPPHGQPGHDCAIPVGQPLNGKPGSAPVTTPAPSAMPNITTTPQMLPTTNNKSSVALNPPHGQPGHDCAIPVGQPLKG